MTAVQGALSAAERSMRSVFVGNIPYEATEEQLKDIFAEVGPVVSFRLVYDRETGKPKGYGFCEYKDQEMALSAMRNLNSYELNGRALRVDNAASEKSKEELKNLQASLGGPPVESPYGPEVSPDECPDAISKIMCSLPPEQLWDLMVQMKQCAENNPNEARNLLIQNSQLAFAMLQAQVILKLVDPEGAKAMLHPPGFQPPAASTLISIPDTKVANAPGPVRNDNLAQFQNAPLIPMQQNPMMNNIRPSHPGQPMTRPALLGERPPIMNDRPGMQDRPVIMGDRMQGPHNPMQGPHNPMQGPHNPMQGPHNPMQGQHNPMQGPHNPMQGPHNPMQGPHNPMQGSQNPMQAPFNDRDRASTKFPQQRMPNSAQENKSRWNQPSDSRALGDHDLRQLPMTDRDMRQPHTTMRDKDMRHAVADQDLRTLGPMGLGDRGFDPRFRNAPTQDRPGFDKPHAGPFENRNIPPRMDDRGPMPGPGVRGPQNPRVSAISESSPRMGGASPMGNNSPQTNNPLAAAAAAIAPHDQEKAALIMQVLQLSDQQISMLPPEQRQSILVLKEQIARSQKM